MAEFKAITTQEEFDDAIKARLERQEKTIAARYSDYDALKAASAKHDEETRSWQKTAQENADLIKNLKAELETAKTTIKDHEIKALKRTIAAEIGLPVGLMDRLAGTTEEEIRKDAESLKAVFETENRKGLPGFVSEPSGGGDPTEVALRSVLSNLTKE